MNISRNEVSGLRARFSSAHLIASIALFVALGGSALAVTKDSIGSKQIRTGAVKTADIKDNGVQGADVAADTLTGGDIDESTLALPTAAPDSPAVPSGPVAPGGPAGGVLTGEYPDPGLALGVVGSEQLAAKSVGRDQIKSAAVSNAEIANGAVSSSSVASNSINSSEITDGELNGDDVGRESGTINGFDAPSIPASDCIEQNVNVGVTEDLRNDAIVASAEHLLQTRVSMTVQSSFSTGSLILQFCNHNVGFSENPEPVDINWVAFDV